jgi:hypothetical protein
MNQDAEHLRLLSIFHYIVGGLAALFSFFHSFTQQWEPFSYLLRAIRRLPDQNQAENCHPNLLAGFLP